LASFRPQSPKVLGQCLLDFFDLAFRHVRRDHLKDDLRRQPWIDRTDVAQRLLDALDKLLGAALPVRFVGRLPLIVIDATNQYRQLCSEIRRLLDGESISTARKACQATCRSGPMSFMIMLVVCSVLSKTSRPVALMSPSPVLCVRRSGDNA
jgi:hypothetical protein